MSRRAFLLWRGAVLFFANVPNLLMVVWLFFWVTRTTRPAVAGALPWNVLVFAGFALSHSVLATNAVKRVFRSTFPAAFERPVYVIVAGLELLALMWLWRPMPALIWRIEGFAGHALDAIYWLALVAAWSVGLSFDQSAFVGTRQLAARLRAVPLPAPQFVVTGAFRHTRNPMYLAMIVLLWSASTLTAGRLLFNVLATGYFLVGLRLEERRLKVDVGEAYERYRQHVPMLVPRLTPWTPS